MKVFSTLFCTSLLLVVSLCPSYSGSFEDTSFDFSRTSLSPHDFADGPLTLTSSEISSLPSYLSVVINPVSDGFRKKPNFTGNWLQPYIGSVDLNDLTRYLSFKLISTPEAGETISQLMVQNFGLNSFNGNVSTSSYTVQIRSSVDNFISILGSVDGTGYQSLVLENLNLVGPVGSQSEIELRVYLFTLGVTQTVADSDSRLDISAMSGLNLNLDTVPEPSSLLVSLIFSPMLLLARRRTSTL